MAEQTLEKAAKVLVTEIVYLGDKLTIPEGITIDDAIGILNRRKEYENQQTVISATFDTFPWDGAYALYKVLKRKFGWASMETVYTFFGPNPPKMMEVETGVGRVESVPWGRLTLFKSEGYIDTGLAKNNSRYVFQANATVLRKHEPVVREIYAEVRKELAESSIYRGQAVSLRFNDDNGNPMNVPIVKFVDTRGITREQLILPDDVTSAIETNLFTPITRMEDCKAVGIPVKRGILLAGDFGTGKTLAARIAAGLAVKEHITFIYCKRTDEFAQAVEFALQYGPAIVFSEDIDRVTTGDRDAEMDQILNIIDGIDTKTSEVMVVLTTNAVEKINQAMLRPGRLDAVIHVRRPDAAAAARLVRYYGGEFIDPEAELLKVGEELKGQIPAIIEEVVKRSKLAALKRTPRGASNVLVGQVDLLEAASTMNMQLELLAGPKPPNPPPDLEQAFRPVIEEAVKRGAKRAAEVVLNGG
jgi:transitional endoplasmic reticulum ATPase